MKVTMFTLVSFEVVQGVQLPVDLAFNYPPDATPWPPGATSFARGIGTGAQIQLSATNTGSGTASDVWVTVKVLTPSGSVLDQSNVLAGIAIGPKFSTWCRLGSH